MIPLVMMMDSLQGFWYSLGYRIFRPRTIIILYQWPRVCNIISYQTRVYLRAIAVSGFYGFTIGTEYPYLLRRYVGRLCVQLQVLTTIIRYIV